MTRLARAIAADLDVDVLDLTEALLTAPLVLVALVALGALLFAVSPPVELGR